MSEPADLSEQPWLLPRLWSMFLLLLLAVTYRLWMIDAGDAEIPPVPLIDYGIAVSGLTTVLPSVLLITALVLIAIDPIRFRRCWWLVAAALVVSFLMDQHRLQPWAYQSAIYAAVFASMDRLRARRWLILLAASVYLYSAAGKFDYQFAHTVGQDFLQTVTRPIGGLPDDLSQSARTKLVFVFPATEFLAGIGLLFRRSRALAATVVILMHVSLIAILGPWGLDHSAGVLVWNILLIVQAQQLMLRPDAPRQQVAPGESPSDDGLPHANIASRMIGGVVILALFAPLLERSGYWDHWPSWSLYSPHTSRASIELHRSAIETLDPRVQTFVMDDTDGDGWRELAIDRWSLQRRGAPIYPQARYQLALAAKLASRNGIGDGIRVQLKGVSDRWTGQRRQKLLLGHRELDKELELFWLQRDG